MIRYIKAAARAVRVVARQVVGGPTKQHERRLDAAPTSRRLSCVVARQVVGGPTKREGLLAGLRSGEVMRERELRSEKAEQRES